jgi:Bacterial regulatory proteins, tetR family
VVKLTQRDGRDKGYYGHILNVGTELFFAEAYGATSIEAVAQRARISERTSITASQTRRHCLAPSCAGSSKACGAPLYEGSLE